MTATVSDVRREQNDVRAYDFETCWPVAAMDRDAVRLLNRQGRVALVYCQLRVGDLADAPLSAILQQLPAELPSEAILSIGRVRTLKEGLERLVRNLIAHPFVETVILLGRDSKVFRPLRGLDCLFRHGLDEGGHIVAPDQDPAVRRVLARDALVNLSAEEVAYFRARSGVRIITDLLDGPATAAEAFAAAVPLVRAATAGRPRVPRWDFLTELDITRWSASAVPVVDVTERLPGWPAPRFAVSFATNTALADSSVTARLTWPGSARVEVQIERTVSLASEKLLHTLLRTLRSAGLAPSDTEAAELGIACESALLSEPEQDATVSKCAATLPERLPTTRNSTLYEATLTATLTPFEDDPAGWLVNRVDHLRGRLFTEVYQTTRPGDASSGRHTMTVTATSTPDGPRAVLAELLRREVFGRHAQRAEHIGYVGIMLRRAVHALDTGAAFVQDRPLELSAPRNVNRRLNAAVLIAADTLADAWRAGLAELRDRGLITDTQKGRVAENWGTLFHIADMGRLTIPVGYPSSEANITSYAEEFFAPRPPGSQAEYTYGDRMCHHYGYDQVEALAERLRAEPGRAAVSQRYDPWSDLGRPHIPCLAFDVWFRHGGRLHTLQVARSHDIAGAMPQNVLGVARGWAARLGQRLGCPLGDVLFLSVSNNFRVADDADHVERVLESGPPPSLARPSRWAEHSHHLPPVEATLDSASPVRWQYWPDGLSKEQAPTELDQTIMTATLTGDTPTGHRLRHHRGLDQVAAFAEHLRRELARLPSYRTQYGVLSPRDPTVDRAGEPSELVCLQLRNQLGRLHAAAVFANTRPGRVARRERLSAVVALQRHAAELVGLPTGSLLALEVGQ